jgi:hypothetical protein
MEGVRLWPWDSVGYYTNLGRKKSIGRKNSFDVDGTTAIENFGVVRNSVLSPGESER